MNDRERLDDERCVTERAALSREIVMSEASERHLPLSLSLSLSSAPVKGQARLLDTIITEDGKCRE